MKETYRGHCLHRMPNGELQRVEYGDHHLITSFSDGGRVGGPSGSTPVPCTVTVEWDETGERAPGETVDHPRHYNLNPSGVEAIDVIEWMTFCIGNAVKYLWRAGHKGDAIEDLKKARWYIDREIERLTKGAE